VTYWEKYKKYFIPVVVGATGGILAGYFSSSYPGLVGLGVGIVLAVVAYRDDPFV
jgi:hypothetical protein